MTIKNADGNIYLTERAAADADIAGDGQLWVKNDTPNTLQFTDDAGTDFNIATTTGVEVATTTLATEQATTSGTSIDFTGIPSGVKKIVVMMDSVVTNGTTKHLIQIGDSGGIETSGYVGVLNHSAGTTEEALSAGFGLDEGRTTASDMTGVATLTLKNSSTNTWLCESSYARQLPAIEIVWAVGRKLLTGELTQVRLTSVSADTFTAGSVNIQYSF